MTLNDTVAWLEAEMDAVEAVLADERERELHAIALGNHDRARYHSECVHARNVEWNTLHRVRERVRDSILQTLASNRREQA